MSRDTASNREFKENSAFIACSDNDNVCVCIKEDNSCVFTVDEQLGGAKKKIFNLVSHFIHSCSQGTSDNDCLYYYYNIPFQLIAGSLSPGKDGDQTDVNLQHEFFVGFDISNGKITFSKYR